MADYPCVHRGGRVRRVPCDLCDTRKGELFSVLACALHGECTPQRISTQVRGCVACEDWLPPDKT